VRRGGKMEQVRGQDDVTKMWGLSGPYFAWERESFWVSTGVVERTPAGIKIACELVVYV